MIQLSDYDLRNKRRELMKAKMAGACTDDAMDALDKLTFTDGAAEAFAQLLQSGDACAVGHALLRAIERMWEREIELDAKIALREQAEAREQKSAEADAYYAKLSGLFSPQ